METGGKHPILIIDSLTLPPAVGFAAVMKLPGHTSADMTLRYLDVTLTALQRELQLARSKPRHLAPRPKTSASLRPGLDGLIDSLLATQHHMEIVGRSLQDSQQRTSLSRLANRLTKILSGIRKLQTT